MTRAVVIGTGPAGITAAATLRRLDPGGTVTALSAEPAPPYSPAAIADHLLTGRPTLYWQGEDVCARLGIDERRGQTVTAVDTDARAVVLADGTRVGYEALVLASGSKLHAPVDGADLPGVLDFKSLTTARRIAERVRAGEADRALVVGHGFIGVELALVLAELGVAVTVVGRRPWVMPRVLDPATAAVAAAALEGRGVRLRLGTPAEAFVGGPDGVTGVRLADGEELRADLVVAATGVKPHTEFLVGSGVDCAWGVSVDDRLRTSVPGVTAAGDVAEAADYATGEHYVHAIFPNAVAQGPLAAANALGADLAYEGAESFNSLKHLGVPIVAIGTMDGADDVVRTERGGALRSLYLRGGVLVGVQLAGDIRGAGVYRSLIRRRVPVGRYGAHLAEGRFGTVDLVFDARAGRALVA